jgi:hypothetical protein
MTALAVVRVGAALGALVACRPAKPVERIANPGEGISVMVYAKDEAGFAVVDDRRWIDIADGVFSLDRIDPAAPLPALVIEPLDRSELGLGSCVRERSDPTPAGLQRLAQGSLETRDPKPAAVSPIVRCRASARGRHLVRVVHVAPAIRYRAQHELAVTGARATITTRFALATPAWGARASVALFDGVPGAEEPPHEVAHGTVQLDGGTAVLAIPARTVAASLRRIYDGAVRDRDTLPTDMAWGRESRRAVWMWLELPHVTLSSGGVRAHVETPGEPTRDLVVSTVDRELVGTTLRLPLWVDDQLLGSRRHFLERDTDKAFSQRFELAVASTAAVPREVWIEERLRPARSRAIARAWPAKPVVEAGIARFKLTVAPGATQRLGFTVDYAP